MIGEAVIDLVTSAPSQSALVRSGVDPRFQLALEVDPSEPISPPMIDITSFGATAQQAIQGANLLTTATQAGLYKLQNSDNINSFYMVKAIDIVKPYQAQVSSSGKLRSIVAVLGAGIIVLLVVVSVTDARDRRRRTRSSGTDTQRRGIPFDDSDIRAAMDQQAVRVDHGSRTRHGPMALASMTHAPSR